MLVRTGKVAHDPSTTATDPGPNWSASRPRAGGELAVKNPASSSTLRGSGVFRQIDGRVYEGDWSGDKRNGLGVEWNADGSVANAGRWENGKLVEALKK